MTAPAFHAGSGPTGRTESPPLRQHPGELLAFGRGLPIDAPNIPAAARDDGKRLATLVARAALHGFACELQAGRIVMRRTDAAGSGWLTFGTIGAADAWLDRIDQPSTEVPA